MKEDVFILYGFVRVADDFVDDVPQNEKGFEKFCTKYYAAMKGKPARNPIIDDFVALSKRREFNPLWTDAFLEAMRSDLHHKPCKTLEDTKRYMYGSAEVIGLFMCAIMGIPEKWYPQARALGQAFQYINFIRDIKEDLDLQRRYLPMDSMQQYGLDRLDDDYVVVRKKEFKAFMRHNAELYISWQKQAQEAFHAIPWRYRVCIATASDMYFWTARTIQKNPFLVYKRKVKPAKVRVMLYLLKNLLWMRY